VAELVRGSLLTAFPSRHAAYKINTNAWLSGLCDTSEPTLEDRLLESQLAVVKCGVCMNEDDADADEEVEEDEEKWGDTDEDGGVQVSFVAKRAARVRSA
jgi:hypothetical protein